MSSNVSLGSLAMSFRADSESFRLAKLGQAMGVGSAFSAAIVATLGSPYSRWDVSRDHKLHKRYYHSSSNTLSEFTRHLGRSTVTAGPKDKLVGST
ncbi:hypothetical protein PIIN_09680 [Serendipita indica DSM 11827]|uniref:Uncharacterized protein n=1 Tax=Serendipita indica (strain DSM 11827) TaxID=1109443 RepID=G4TWJ7_SERID|nr:hypothetical protein PIIN_09680 [Serendipita indica DSM 11827]